MLQQYLQQLLHLNRSKSFGGAPHKPVLLLAIVRLIRAGEIISNRIEITPDLVLEFKEIWSRVVDTPHTANFSLPFYHMKSEPFWRLITRAGLIIPTTSSNSIKSFAALKETVAFAEIDRELFIILQNSEDSALIEDSLMNRYFPHMNNQLNQPDNSLFKHISEQIEQDDELVYSQRIIELKATLAKEDFEEEIFVRSGIFKRSIPRIYNYQCAISGSKIESTSNSQMIDACHIKPFAISRDDTISNGIALSPTLHRAFDRGLITITENYVVRISPTMKENDSPFALSQFEGNTIFLPNSEKHYPSPHNLAWHRKETFLL